MRARFVATAAGLSLVIGFAASSGRSSFRAAGEPTLAATSVPVVRVAGEDRIATAIAASQRFGPDRSRGPAFQVALSRADDYADALVASMVTGTWGPLLLTQRDHLDPRTRAEIARVMPLVPSGPPRTVYLVGGDAALAPAVADELRTMGYQVVRYAGADRYETALAVANATIQKWFFAEITTIVLATGATFPDALVAGPVAAKAFDVQTGGASMGVVLLTRGPILPRGVADFTAAHPRAARYAIGGAAARADPGATPVAGSDRYATARGVLERFFCGAPFCGSLTVVSGEDFPDALAAGALGLPLLLTRRDTLPTVVSDYLANHAYSDVTIFGGPNAVTPAVEAQIATLAS